MSTKQSTEKNQSSIEQKKAIEEEIDEQEGPMEIERVLVIENHILEEISEKIHLPLAGQHIPKKISENHLQKNHTDPKENLDHHPQVRVKKTSETILRENHLKNSKKDYSAT